MDPQDEEMDQEELELQMALALSLAEAQPGDPPLPAGAQDQMQALLAQALGAAMGGGAVPPAADAAPPAAAGAPGGAAQPAAAPLPAANPGGGGLDLNNELAQQFAMFQHLMQQQGGGAPAPPAPAQGGNPAPPPAPAARASTRAAAPAPTAPLTPPPWAAGLDKWYAKATGTAAAVSKEVTLANATELQTFLGVLSKALGTAVTSEYSASNPSLVLKTQRVGEGQVQVRGAEVHSLVAMWLRRPSLLASGTGQLRALQNALDALLAAGKDTTGPVSQSVSLVSSSLGQAALQLLAADEEDLYFEKGQHTSEIIKQLKTPLRAGAGVSPAFVAAVAGSVRDSEGAKALVKLLRTLVDDCKSITSLGSSPVELEPLALALDTFTSPADMTRCMMSLLYSDCVLVGNTLASQATQRPGSSRSRGQHSAAKLLQANCVLSPLLQLSSLVDALGTVTSRQVVSRAAATFTQLKGFPSNEGEINTAIQVVGQTQTRLQDVLHGLLKRLVTFKDPSTPAGAGREAVLAWLAASAAANWERTLAGERGVRGQVVQEFSTGCSDGWCVNVVGVCLGFARPFVEGYWDTQSKKFADLFTKHLSADYYAHNAHRLPDLSKINSLAGGRGRSVQDAITDSLPPNHTPPLISTYPWPTQQPSTQASKSQQSAAAASTAPQPASFIADCFFLTQTWLHVGLMPALFRYQRLSEMMNDWAKQAREEEGGSAPMGRGQLTPQMVQVYLLSACERASLLEPRLVEDTVQFCLLQICWLHHLIQQPNAATSFALVPEYALGDTLTWLTFVISSGLAVHVASKDIGALTNALTALLDAPQLVRSPVMSDKMVRLLLTMLAPQLGVAKRVEDGGRGALAPTMQRPGEAALVAAVLNSQAARSGALPAALMRAYVGADHVVGLDVDRDSFDKFTMRSCIDSILEELWRDERGRRSLISLAETGTAAAAAASTAAPANTQGHTTRPFEEYVECLFNSLIYLFKDSLDRLVDIAKVETAKSDEPGWAARPKEERDTQEDFLRSQAHTCRGFMRIAVQSLTWLNTLAQHPQTGTAFCRSPLSGRVAYSLLHFIEVLSGQKAQEIKVSRPQQYLWDRLGLLGKVCGLATSLAACREGQAFVTALAAEPDMDIDTLKQARDQLESHHAVTESTAMSALITRLTPAAGAGGGGETPGAAAILKASPNTEVPPAKRTRIDGEPTSTGTMDADTHNQLPSQPAAAAADSSAQQLSLPGPELSAVALQQQYTELLGSCQLDTFDSTASRAYHSAFHTLAEESAASNSAAMMKRVSKEIRDLSSGKTSLPCSPPASIFLRYDADNMNKMRALITGPEGTPYAYGCFVFDLLFPTGYPTTAMLVHFETTGQGRARFNPNLYADGKVCLSLINTWHASHESEKWNPDVTTTMQVLVSIQAMILVEDPYYNEPAHEAARGTDTGRSSAAMYNANLTLQTLRWAIIDKLRKPPPGFEDVVRNHFKLLRHKVLSTAQRWAQAAVDTGDEALAKRTHTAVKELHQLLSEL